MITIYSDAHNQHHGKELKDGLVKPSFEEPNRANTIHARVKSSGLGDIITPEKFDLECYTRAHSERYIRFLKNAWEEWIATGRDHDALGLVWPVRSGNAEREPEVIDGKLGFYSMDAGAPIATKTWQVVRVSADLALTGIDLINRGEQSAFALCRPPGHHASYEHMGGYCYLNNAAIAACQAKHNGAERVAVLDVDFHHGNGTQDIFYQRDDVLTISIHGDPSFSYPYFSGFEDERGSGTGEGFNINFPLKEYCDWVGYTEALESAIGRLQEFSPDVLVVSLGVDTYKDDPISHFELENEDYLKMGQAISKVKAPTLFVMEGGYMVDEIGINAVNVLQGFDA